MRQLTALGKHYAAVDGLRKILGGSCRQIQPMLSSAGVIYIRTVVAVLAVKINYKLFNPA